VKPFIEVKKKRKIKVSMIKQRKYKSKEIVKIVKPFIKIKKKRKIIK